MFEKDKEVLKDLALQYAEIAALPIQKDTRRAWNMLHRLKPERPMFMIDELSWNEMNVNDELTLRCEHTFYKEIELNLRRQLYRWNHFRDDFVYESIIYIPKIIHGTIIPISGMYEGYVELDFGIRVEEETRQYETDNLIAAHSYKDQLQEEKDLAKIYAPMISLNVEETNLRESMAHDALDGILEVCMDGNIPWFSPWDYLTQWRKMDNLLFDIVDKPDLVHKTIDHLTNVYLEILDQLEEKGLLGHPQQTVHCCGAWTDLLPAEGYDPKKPRAKDVWTFGSAQLMYMVSPEVHNKLEVDYAKKWYARFGLGYYGCCEPLEDRLDYIKTIPNIRKISVSAWVKDYERFAEELEGKYVFSNKPTPARLVDAGWYPSEIEKELRERLAISEKYNCPSEFTLKDISTVNHHPERVWQWAEIMRNICRGG